MEDELYLGPTPCDEECAQVGTENYSIKAVQECRRYIELLEKKFGKPPENARFAVKSCPHDFGTYYEVVIKFRDNDEKAIDYAFNVENNLPERWE